MFLLLKPVLPQLAEVDSGNAAVNLSGAWQCWGTLKMGAVDSVMQLSLMNEGNRSQLHMLSAVNSPWWNGCCLRAGRLAGFNIRQIKADTAISWHNDAAGAGGLLHLKCCHVDQFKYYTYLPHHTCVEEISQILRYHSFYVTCLTTGYTPLTSVCDI